MKGKGRGLISKGLTILGIAAGLFLINSRPAHATMIYNDYEPTFEYQYGAYVDETLGYTALNTVSTQAIGASNLNFGVDGNYALQITGTAQPPGHYLLDISSTPIQVHDPSVFLYLNIKITANVYLPYEIRYVDESGNLLLTDNGRIYEDNKWENTQHEFIAVLSDAGQRYRVKGSQTYSASEFRDGTPPEVFISTLYAQPTGVNGSKTVVYTLVCEKVTGSGGSGGGSGSGSGGTGGGSGGSGGSGGGSGGTGGGSGSGTGSGSGGSGSGTGGGSGSGTGGGSGSGSGGGSGSGSGGGSGSGTGGGSGSGSGSGSGGGSSSGSGRGSSGGGSAVLSKSGWIYNNKEDAWYYYSGRTRNTLKKGWHYDSYDKKWYYLALDNGRMLKGWNLISDKWYFFTPETSEKTWELRSDGEWYYLNNVNIRPLGSMYSKETTPDGYKVSADGQYEP